MKCVSFEYVSNYTLGLRLRWEKLMCMRMGGCVRVCVWVSECVYVCERDKETEGQFHQQLTCTAFTHPDPKSMTIQSSWQYLFALLGSTCVKPLCKQVDEINTEWVTVSKKAAKQLNWPDF